MNAIAEIAATRTAVLDEANAGHIHGAFGTIRQGDHGPRESWKHRFQTLLRHSRSGSHRHGRRQ